MSVIQPIHPFPARMAPEIVLEECRSLAPGSLVLDPMAGSGTALRAAAEEGHRALGFDLDPLSVLMARVWTTPIDVDELRIAAASVVAQARSARTEDVSLPWIDDDAETRDFVDYWFAARQQCELRRVSSILQGENGPIGDALKIGLSRTIVTKQRGASLAWDVSHSRPHRVREENDFPVIEEFLRSANRLAHRLEEEPPPGSVSVRLGDARRLLNVDASSVDAVVTSPPYLNAIDYMRGHRLSLVWLGYRLSDLRAIRSESIGSERMADPGMDRGLASQLTASIGPIDRLPQRVRRTIDRYVLDAYEVLKEARRVLRFGGRAILVVGNSTLRGVFVQNASAVRAAAERAGLRLVAQQERPLPPSRRYLPPPTEDECSGLEKRMRTETVLAFVKS